jgi:hypothetical protein
MKMEEILSNINWQLQIENPQYKIYCAGILEQSTGAKNRVGIGFCRILARQAIKAGAPELLKNV